MAVKSVTREQWAAALRSGEYTQGTGMLYNPQEKTFCCLGVLGVLAGGKPNQLRGQLDFEECGVKTPSTEYLPREVSSMVDLPIDLQAHFVCLNDGKTHSFAEIADVIENLPRVPEES